MASEPANNSPPSRSYFQKTISLQDWWLTKPQTDDDRKTLGVSGLTCNSQLSRAERCFSSAPIVKAYDFFELETVDGICVLLQGYINKDKTLENGFSSEVFDHFEIGFPLYWEEFSSSCPKSQSVDECVSRENEEEKDSIEQDDGKALHHDSHTILVGVEGCDDTVLNDKISSVSDASPVKIPHNHIMKGGHESKNLEGDQSEVVRRRTTRSMGKINGCDDDDDENLGRKVLKEEKHNESQKAKLRSNKKKRVEEGSKSKRKLTCPEMDLITTPKSTLKNKGDAKILSPESFSGKKSRCGRVLLPNLEFWRNQTVVYDAGLDREVTGVHDVPQSSTDIARSRKKYKKRA